MGSSHCGEVGLGKGRSSSSRKGKKTSTLEKPKQPQRGLGVAQLEKIRLHNQLMAGFHIPSLIKQMGFGESESNDRYFDSQSCVTSRYTMTQNSARMPVTLPLLEQTMEPMRRRHDRSHSTGSMSQNSDSSGSQEPDLELRLSL
ncbi:hypothetical protein J5N97_007770 [Dioscorea zingiberensis]|uniref:Uncharacterized protein n=1 Tax=Dioscorea zingiberensis TaxID=325984 RepID=A0A9D5DD61_9LILI|nr:hypothetical protein J5N97_007770 [Dioscorea zingiberensis]